MDTTRKYELIRNEAKTLRLSLGAVTVKVAVQDGRLCMWMREPPDELAPKPRIFVALPSWESFSRGYAHVGTCKDAGHFWHVLEVL
ncbi:hypothetical protein EHF33_20560 (plasmid) [Deinococcus psychrotolerans]|uniref:DUF7352 domain-containing protein n=1 Tax=Deinococcus psychrotolerans TaxID=2489213 RepID=A0A3G8YRZ3_9DEIO|nr:hypothetical protein [Deinococcus psychrotolerans]AZI45304.1 hypothetical protein EHF33_20560 [Deinococcus psychrotolerans]